MLQAAFGASHGTSLEPASATLRPTSDRPCRIAVIGAGFSGALTAIHLLWNARPGERIYLVEKSGRLGQGLAYATGNPEHLLNVRASRMSAFEEEPDHFLRWLKRLPAEERDSATAHTPAGTFVRRSVYGEYIQSLLRDAITRQGGSRNLFIISDEAVALRPILSGLDLETACGRCYGVDAAILALGNFPPARTGSLSDALSPWESHALDGLDPARPVLLVGTGLTMVDTCLELLARGFQGPIHALSRRGLLPLPHAAIPAPWDIRFEAPDSRSLLHLLRSVRRAVAAADAAGIGWHAVLDALRPQVQSLWQSLSAADRHRFLRHLRPWWDVHRHRLAPTVAATIRAARSAGRLNILAGRIERVVPADSGSRVYWNRRGGTAGQPLDVQCVINCTGPEVDVTRLNDPLLRQLLADGMVRPDPWRLGLDASAQGSIVRRDGDVSQRLFAVGPVARGALWEVTSVPDIRSQAEQVAMAALGAARRDACEARSCGMS